MKGRGGSILAARELANVKAATDYVWRALECVTTNGIGGAIRLARTRAGDEACKTFLQEVKPNVVIGNVEPGEGGVDIVQAFVRTEARTLLLAPALNPCWTSLSRRAAQYRQRGNILFRQPGPHSSNDGGPYKTWGGVMAPDKL